MDEYHPPRTWKYVVPGAIVALLIPLTGKMIASTNPEIQFWAIVPIGLVVLFTIVTLVNLWKYMSEHATQMFYQHQSALSTTPLVLLAQSMKQMHPEAVRVLNRFGVRTNWEVKVNANLGERDWVLMGTNVHLGFIEFVLSNSRTALYPKNRFSQGSLKWDPDGLVEDREQYEEFEMWMFARLMVTRSHGDFRPAEFIPPWTPSLIMEMMGMTGEQDLYYPKEEVRKDLNGHALTSRAEGSQQSAASNDNGQKAEGRMQGEPELSDEEMDAITKEQLAYSEKYLQ